MIAYLAHNHLVLLFLVMAIGYPLGRVSIAGTSMGAAAVLFVGLAAGALDPALELPAFVRELGLVIFVYTMGLSSARGFLTTFRGKNRGQGLRAIVLVAGALVLGAGLAVALTAALGLQPAVGAGMFTGAVTNTPALGAAIDALRRAGLEGHAELGDPGVGYSIAYPMGVMGVIAALHFARLRWGKASGQAEADGGDAQVAGQALQNRTIAVTCAESAQTGVRQLLDRFGNGVIFGRMRRDGKLSLAAPTTRFRAGDLVNVIGPVEVLDEVTAVLGVVSDERLEADRREFDNRRIFVSNRDVAGRTLRDLDMPRTFGAVITRVRRGDVEFLPDGDTVLELGDRVRVVTHRDHMAAVTKFLGDSYRALSEIDVMTFSLGMALGLLVGSIPVPLPGGTILQLGLAGGPLVVALILGARERTGPLVWSLPYSANLTLRQVGLMLFLAGVGTRSGHSFATTLGQGAGLGIFLGGLAVTMVASIVTLWIGHRVLHIPFGVLSGILSGQQTQPAALAFAVERQGDESPNVGYATVYPVAMITKIILGQVLITVLLML